MTQMRQLAILFAAGSLALSAAAAGNTAAAAAPKLDRCEVTARSQAVVLLLCTASANMDSWRSSGKAACAGTADCNAWIWDDAGKAPKQAPATSKDMPKDAARGAKAIWLNDAEQMVQIRPAAR